MITFTIPLADLILSPTQEIDLLDLPEDEAILRLAAAYAFLPPPIAISIADDNAVIAIAAESRPTAQTNRLFEQATAQANHGRYDRAIDLFTQFITQVPDAVDARRNLGMALLEQGDVAAAEQRVMEAVKLAPRDPYSLLLIGNIYMRRQQPAVAERFYRRAIAAAPQDPYILSNYAALLTAREDHTAARRYYDQAIAADPAYPNPYLGKAISFQRQEDYAAATAALEDLFTQPESLDIRSEPVYQEAQRLYHHFNQERAQQQLDANLAYVHAWRQRLEAEQGIEIEFVHDPNIDYPAITEPIWHRPQRTSHVIRYREAGAPILPHLLGRALQQLTIEHNTREAGRNRLFASTPETFNAARAALAADIDKLRRAGTLGALLDAHVNNLIKGLANQLYNMPLDMFIEHALYHGRPNLRPAQFLSLAATQAQGRQVLTDPQIKQITPRLIYNANITMNGAYALFTDELFHGATSYAAPYTDNRVFRKSRQIYGSFLAAIADYQPGDEYILIDQIAADLRLQRWYTWQKDEAPADPTQKTSSVTNPELLKKYDMASTMYCLSALQRFENMRREEILAIVGEIALLGRSGLDYASSAQKYTLDSIPDRPFSGLELMCIMYVGFKDVEPTVDLGYDLSEPYQLALKMHNA